MDTYVRTYEQLVMAMELGSELVREMGDLAAAGLAAARRGC
jgi:hypothetical protein